MMQEGQSVFGELLQFGGGGGGGGDEGGGFHGVGALDDVGSGRLLGVLGVAGDAGGGGEEGDLLHERDHALVDVEVLPLVLDGLEALGPDLADHVHDGEEGVLGTPFMELQMATKTPERPRPAEQWTRTGEEEEKWGGFAMPFHCVSTSRVKWTRPFWDEGTSWSPQERYW